MIGLRKWNEDSALKKKSGGFKAAIGWTDPARAKGILGGLRFYVKLAVLRLQPHQYLRYAPVLQYLKARARVCDALSVLEVGSGSVGVTRFWPHPTTGVDLGFDGAQLPFLAQRVGSATDLPFSDSTFDSVISVDVFEHLTPADRRTSLAEMIRVASYGVLVGFPCGSEAREAEEWGRARCHRALEECGSIRRKNEISRRSAFLSEHVEHGLPSKESFMQMIDSLVAGDSVRVTAFGNQSTSAWRFLLPSVVPFSPWSVPLRRLLAMLLLPWLLRSRKGGHYRQFFFIEKRGQSVVADRAAASMPR